MVGPHGYCARMACLVGLHALPCTHGMPGRPPCAAVHAWYAELLHAHACINVRSATAQCVPVCSCESGWEARQMGDSSTSDCSRMNRVGIVQRARGTFGSGHVWSVSASTTACDCIAQDYPRGLGTPT